MIDAVVIQPGTDTGEPSVAGVSWAAVAAGAIVSCALTLVLLAFGLGLGLSVVSPSTTPTLAAPVCRQHKQRSYTARTVAAPLRRGLH